MDAKPIDIYTINIHKDSIIAMEVIAKVCLIVSLSGGVSMSGLWTPDPEFAEVISLISTNIEAAR